MSHRLKESKMFKMLYSVNIPNRICGIKIQSMIFTMIPLTIRYQNLLKSDENYSYENINLFIIFVIFKFKLI